MTDIELAKTLDRIESKLNRCNSELTKMQEKLDTLLKRSNRWSTRSQQTYETRDLASVKKKMTATVAQLQDPDWRKANGMDE